TPAAAKVLANSSNPDLSETDNNARWIRSILGRYVLQRRPGSQWTIWLAANLDGSHRQVKASGTRLASYLSGRGSFPGFGLRIGLRGSLFCGLEACVINSQIMLGSFIPSTCRPAKPTYRFPKVLFYPA